MQPVVRSWSETLSVRGPRCIRRPMFGTAGEPGTYEGSFDTRYTRSETREAETRVQPAQPVGASHRRRDLSTVGRHRGCGAHRRLRRGGGVRALPAELADR